MYARPTDKIIGYYNAEADTLCAMYESLDAATVLGDAAKLIPAKPSVVLDAAAGSGRDAAWLRNLGHRVVAVEPAERMRQKAVDLHGDDGIEWVADALPELSSVQRPPDGFAFILVAAVWMHLEPHERQPAMRRLAELAAPESHVLLTFRHGPGDDRRPMFPITTVAEINAARAAGFRDAWTVPVSCEDHLGRNAVTWDFVALLR